MKLNGTAISTLFTPTIRKVEKEGPVPTAATTQQLYQSFYKSLGDQLAGQWDRWRRREEAGKETVMCAAK